MERPKPSHPKLQEIEGALAILLGDVESVDFYWLVEPYCEKLDVRICNTSEFVAFKRHMSTLTHALKNARDIADGSTPLGRLPVDRLVDLHNQMDGALFSIDNLFNLKR